MLQGFHYWPEACERFAIPELIGDPRFDTAEKLMANAREAAALVAQAIGSKTLEEWKVQLFGMHGQWSPVIDTLEGRATIRRRLPTATCRKCVRKPTYRSRS